MSVTLHEGDCLEVMARLAREGVRVDAIVCDPPYHLTSIVKRFGKLGSAAAKHGSDGLYARASAGFMGKQWDGGDIAFRAETWKLALDLLKPGGHMFAFSGTRTYHRMAVAIEDAGFVIRDQFGWAYGSGFPKSHDISKAIDKAGGVWRGRSTRALPSKSVAKGTEYERVAKGDPICEAAREWDGWGTAVKPAWEPICLAQKPVEGTIAGNVLKYRTGGLNIDGCRIGCESTKRDTGTKAMWGNAGRMEGGSDTGRFPANFTHDGSPEVLACFPDTGGSVQRTGKRTGVLGEFHGQDQALMGHDDDGGSAARFFYSSKAGADDRWGSKHPTVKPIDLIRYYARLITPPGGLILDPFAGSGTLGVAAMAEGFDAILIEREAEYAADIRERIAFYEGGDRHSVSSRNRHATPKCGGAGPLIDLMQAAEA